MHGIVGDAKPLVWREGAMVDGHAKFLRPPGLRGLPPLAVGRSLQSPSRPRFFG